MSAVPDWLQVAQATATPVIAAIVGFIAWRQWKTAHTKMLFDLFDKRIEAYNALFDAMRPAFRDGTINEFRDFIQLRHAIDAAHFLFGDDVRNILRELISIGAIMNSASNVMRDSQSPQYSEWVEKNHKAMLRLIEISDELPNVMEDYLAFSEKRSSARRWLQKKNKIRLSYADEYQK